MNDPAKQIFDRKNDRKCKLDYEVKSNITFREIAQCCLEVLAKIMILLAKKVSDQEGIETSSNNLRDRCQSSQTH